MTKEELVIIKQAGMVKFFVSSDRKKFIIFFVPRRKKDDDLIWGLAQIFGLIFCLGLLVPGVRQMLFSLIIWLVIGLIIIGGLCVIGFFIFKRPMNRSALEKNDLTTLQTLSPSSQNIPPKNEIQTTHDLIKRLRNIDWFQFEKLVELLYWKLGYDVTRKGGANPDGGIDLIVEKGGLKTAIQCKQWKTWNVGVKAIREFLGALIDADIQSGIFITLNGYSDDAKQLAEKHGIEIIDERELAEMLNKTDMKFDPAALEILNDTRKFCPKCESEMVLRTASKGQKAGEQFWGCSGFPQCRYIMPIKTR